jgi:hypothetical protein
VARLANFQEAFGFDAYGCILRKSAKPRAGALTARASTLQATQIENTPFASALNAAQVRCMVAQVLSTLRRSREHPAQVVCTRFCPVAHRFCLAASRAGESTTRVARLHAMQAAGTGVLPLFTG